MIYIEHQIINFNREIGVDEWERFEYLADTEPQLWTTFWTISSDKKEIKKNKICKNFYFSKFALQMLYQPMTKLVRKKRLTKDDIEIIFSLFNRMLPKYQCKDCQCMSIE
tara:strand:- start:312 stop:641 length:330 start_codon:yes stop_codon:yes gene_type:complete